LDGCGEIGRCDQADAGIIADAKRRALKYKRIGKCQ
jgi:hypothetical protein